MATIQKRIQNSVVRHRAMIRQNHGYPPASKTLPTKEEAKYWAKLEEACRRQGRGPTDQIKGKSRLWLTSFDRHMTIILPTKPERCEKHKGHLDWWRDKISKYELTRISPDLIAQCRQELSEGVTIKKLNAQTQLSIVNRYLATLSTALHTALKNAVGFDNPCLRVTKFKESKGRDRSLSTEELFAFI